MDFTKEDIKEIVNEFFERSDKRDQLCKLNLRLTKEQLKKVSDVLNG